MNDSLTITEFTIVIVAQNHNPSILNPDFLKYNKIVPMDWEIAEPPICVEPMSQVSFKGGLKINAQFDKVIFKENIEENKLEEIKVPAIAKKYITVLPHVDYKAVGINLRGHIIFDSEDSVAKYILETYISEGPWREIGTAPVRTSIKFLYSFDEVRCNLTIDIGELKKVNMPVLLFSANSHHDITGSNKQERLDHLHQIIDAWKKDIDMFKKITDQIMPKKEVA
jgi:hypothetical protein